MHHRNIHCVAIEMYKAKNKLSPEIVQNIFQQRDISTLRSEVTFIRPDINTVYNGEDSLRNFGPIVWNNMLPNNLKSETTLEKFKNNVKLWVPENCPCRPCIARYWLYLIYYFKIFKILFIDIFTDIYIH